MNQFVSIIYAFRNRDANRVRLSLESLQKQSNTNFAVVFVDYGSDIHYSKAVRDVVGAFHFTTYYYVAHPGLLWNKSKAMNYGISKAATPYIFIADVDLIFSPETINFFENRVHPDKVNLFKLAYLDKRNSLQLTKKYRFEALEAKHSGTINGMILVNKKALETVQGYDTFFHFYGSEDVELYSRLSNAGYEVVYNEGVYFYHNWHVIYNSYNDGKMSVSPHLYNIKRINQQHYFNTISNKLVVSFGQSGFGTVVTEEDQYLLQDPTIMIELVNTHAQIFHFFNEQIKSYTSEVVRVIVKEDVYYKSTKHFLKKLLKKQSQPYISMKEVNDIILSKIVYEYRDTNYAYQIADNLKTITFTIRL